MKIDKGMGRSDVSKPDSLNPKIRAKEPSLRRDSIDDIPLHESVESLPALKQNYHKPKSSYENKSKENRSRDMLPEISVSSKSYYPTNISKRKKGSKWSATTPAKLSEAEKVLERARVYLANAAKYPDLYDLLEDNKHCSETLKEINKTIDLLVQRHRDDLLREPLPRDRKSLTARARLARENIVLQNDFESNERLIKYLSLELERLSDTITVVENPGYKLDVSAASQSIIQEINTLTEEVKEIRRCNKRLALQLEHKTGPLGKASLDAKEITLLASKIEEARAVKQILIGNIDQKKALIKRQAIQHSQSVIKLETMTAEVKAIGVENQAHRENYDKLNAECEEVIKNNKIMYKSMAQKLQAKVTQAETLKKFCNGLTEQIDKQVAIDKEQADYLAFLEQKEALLELQREEDRRRHTEEINFMMKRYQQQQIQNQITLLEKELELRHSKLKSKDIASPNSRNIDVKVNENRSGSLSSVSSNGGRQKVQVQFSQQVDAKDMQTDFIDL